MGYKNVAACGSLVAAALVAALWLTSLAIARSALHVACRDRLHCSLEGSITLKKSFKTKAAELSGRDKAGEERFLKREAKDFADTDGVVLWTLATFSWVDFAFNWVASVRAAGIENFFVACLDEEIMAKLQEHNIPALRLQADLGADDLSWGSDKFIQRGREKIKFIKSMVSAGLQPFFADLDVVWLKNPIPYIKHFPEAHILIATDILGPTKFDGGLEQCPDMLGESYMGMQNVGIHLMRPGADTVLDEWQAAMDAEDIMEQRAFNNVLGPTLKRLKEDSPLCSAMNGEVVLGLLPPASFASGHVFFVQHLTEWQEVDTGSIYAVHANHFIGRNTKRHLLREKGLWQADRPSRFAPPGGFMAFDMDVPMLMLDGAGPPLSNSGTLTRQDAAGHISLMLYQLEQLGVAMQIAMALGRELIIPPIWRGLENAWFEHPGHVPGAHHYKLPSICPLARIVDIELWTANAKAGKLPLFHEFAILQHPLMTNRTRLIVRPEEVTADRGVESAEVMAVSKLLGTSARKCIASAAVNPAAVPCELTVARNQTDQQVQSALKEFHDVTVIHFTDVRAVWARASNTQEKHFKQATEGLVEPWCCIQGNVKIPLHL